MAVAANQRLTYNSNGSIQSQNLLLSTEKKTFAFTNRKITWLSLTVEHNMNTTKQINDINMSSPS